MNSNSNISINDIEYDLNMEKYRQLHNVVLNFSNNSIEIKKMCITTLSAIPAIIIAFFKNINITYVIYILLCITLLFYFIDVYTYYYQKKLREIMKVIELNIKNSSNNSFELSQSLFSKLIKNSFFNYSHLIYYLLIIFLLISLFIIHNIK